MDRQPKRSNDIVIKIEKKYFNLTLNDEISGKSTKYKIWFKPISTKDMLEISSLQQEANSNSNQLDEVEATEFALKLISKQINLLKRLIVADEAGNKLITMLETDGLPLSAFETILSKIVESSTANPPM